MNKLHQYIYTFIVLSLFSIQISAQPSAVQKAGKAVLTLTTFSVDGNIISSSKGIFVGANGEAISAWKPFVGAARATVVDASGRQSDVTEIIGANELYDVCKFRVNSTSTPAKLTTAPLSQGEKVWLVGYALKKPETKELTVKSVESFMEQYAYYIFPDAVDANLVSCPVVNASGQVVGLSQQTDASASVHAVDARYPNGFTQTSGLAINDALLSQTHIRKALPEAKDQATLALIMAGQQPDSTLYAQTIDAFIRQFPNEIDGYSAKAATYIGNNIAAADQQMQLALKNVTAKDAVHSEYAKLIYQQQLYHPDSLNTLWTLDKALAEAEKAWQLNPLPVYQHQQAQIIYSKGQYQQAYDMFIALAEAQQLGSEPYLEAAQCKTQLHAPHEEVIALLDKAIEACSRPLTNIAAPYILARGQAYDAAGEYRKAIRDYNQYDTLMVGRAAPEFYYIKYQCEVKARQYQQAITDIAHAALLNPLEPTYLAELASLNLKVNRPDDAIKAADLCLRLAPNYPDAYIVKALALIHKGDKTAGIQVLEQALPLNDERIQPLIDKYKQ